MEVGWALLLVQPIAAVLTQNKAPGWCCGGGDRVSGQGREAGRQGGRAERC